MTTFNIKQISLRKMMISVALLSIALGAAVNLARLNHQKHCYKKADMWLKAKQNVSSILINSEKTGVDKNVIQSMREEVESYNRKIDWWNRRATAYPWNIDSSSEP